jgi:hypothetical protein
MPNGKKSSDPDRSSETRLLREIAGRLREIARAHPTAMSDKLLEVAKEFDDHADELERRLGGARQ